MRYGIHEDAKGYRIYIIELTKMMQWKDLFMAFMMEQKTYFSEGFPASEDIKGRPIL